MIQNGRKSAFSRTVVKPERARVPLVPPAHLNDEERTFLLDLLKDAAPEQFIPTDMPVLASYAEACIAARRAKQAGDWDALVRDLLENHYDPAYRKSLFRNYKNAQSGEAVPVNGISRAAFLALARRLIG